MTKLHQKTARRQGQSLKTAGAVVSIANQTSIAADTVGADNDIAADTASSTEVVLA